MKKSTTIFASKIDLTLPEAGRDMGEVVVIALEGAHHRRKTVAGRKLLSFYPTYV